MHQSISDFGNRRYAGRRKEEGRISFGVNMLTHHCIPVTYLPLHATMQTVPKQGLFYKSQEAEGGSYLITETYLLKDNDVIRLFIHQEDFAILLRKKKISASAIGVLSV